MDGARVLIHSAGLSFGFWLHAIKCRVHILNRTVVKSNGEMFVPYTVLYRTKPDLSNLKVFGSKGLGRRSPNFKNKFTARSEKCTFLGYSSSSGSYVVRWSDGSLGTTRSLQLNELDVVKANVSSVDLNDSTATPATNIEQNSKSNSNDTHNKASEAAERKEQPELTPRLTRARAAQLRISLVSQCHKHLRPVKER